MRRVSEPAVRARVEAFIADFHAAWLRAGQPSRDREAFQAAFDAWRAELARVAGAHLADHVPTGAEGSMSSQAPHGPDETLDAVVVADDGATGVVHSTMPHVVPSYYTYSLERAGGTWVIARIEEFLDPPGAPLVPLAEAERLLASATDVLGAPLEAGDDPSVLFRRFTVVPVGTVTTSGVLVVRDLGYQDHDLEPLACRVPAGTYPVEAAVGDALDGDLNLALRLVLSEAPVASWCHADQVGGGHVAGVDTGTISVADLAGLVGLEAQETERRYTDQALEISSTGGVAFALSGTGAPDCVLAQSGYGDGGYPAFWGLDAAGRPAQLVVDFRVVDRTA